jgi:hypothetical protein
MLNALGTLISSRFIERPILVVGTGRSGTSVLLQALGQHPLIYALPGEAPFLTSMGGAAYLFTDSPNSSYYLRSLRVEKSYLFRQLRRVGFETAAGEHCGVKRHLRGLLGRAPSPLGRRFWCAKTFPSENVTRGLNALYPAVRFVYITRNGCDVVHSRTKFKGFTHQDFRQHCINWANDVAKYRHLTRTPEAIRVTQESLQEDPATLFERIFRFLDISQHPGPADYAKTTVVHPLDEATKRGPEAQSLLGKRVPGHAVWNDQQRSTFKEICSDGMSELGYEMPY